MGVGVFAFFFRPGGSTEYWRLGCDLGEFMVCVCVCLGFCFYDGNGNTLVCFPRATINMVWYGRRKGKKGMD